MKRTDFVPKSLVTAPTTKAPLPVIKGGIMNRHAAFFNPRYYLSPAAVDILNRFGGMAGNSGTGTGTGEETPAETLTPFEVSKKSGFVSKSDVLIILDQNKKVFYFKIKKGKETRYNLPKGNYFLFKGDFEALPKPIVYKQMVLPAPYAYTKQPPKRFKVVFTDNPNKCSVDLKNDTVYFDNTFKNYPRYVIEYILAHEKGHYFYRGRGQKSELDCDKYAAAYMLNKGYNPSQISAAVRFTLGNSKNSTERKNENWENIKNVFI